MTLEEVAERLGKAPSTIKNNFKRTQETLAKQGISLTKNGDNYSLEIIKEKVQNVKISQLIQVLTKLQNEIGDVIIYKTTEKGFCPIHKIFNANFQGISDDELQNEGAVILD